MTVADLFDKLEALGDSFSGGWYGKVCVTDFNGMPIDVVNCEIQLDYENGHRLMLFIDETNK